MEHYMQPNEIKAPVAFKGYIFDIQASLRVLIYTKLRTVNLWRVYYSFICEACC